MPRGGRLADATGVPFTKGGVPHRPLPDESGASPAREGAGDAMTNTTAMAGATDNQGSP